ncbi:hypothetical protein GOODEAATRI_013842, partial [Goodea atripinnis]
VPSGSHALAKGYMTEWVRDLRYWMPLQLLKLQKMSFPSIFAEATFSSFQDYLITKRKGDRGISEGLWCWSSQVCWVTGATYSTDCQEEYLSRRLPALQ